jgi:hypothetical protein
MTSIVGGVFPISSKHVSRIFDDGRTVFVKYTSFKKFKKNSKIIFCISKGKRLFGEGIIEGVERMDPKTAWSRFGQKIFLDEDEFEQYRVKSPIGGQSRMMSEITVYSLRGFRKYGKNIQLPTGMTPAGHYMTNEEYKKILNQSVQKVMTSALSLYKSVKSLFVIYPY